MPDIVAAEIVRFEFPVFVIVSVIAALVVLGVWFAKVSNDADKLMVDSTPAPVKVTDCGLPGALSAMDIVAVRLPEAEGVNLTPMEQEELGRIAAPVQVSEVLAKSPALGPVNATEEMERSRIPVLVTVTVWAAEGMNAP